jgi:hypothetical protein
MTQAQFDEVTEAGKQAWKRIKTGAVRMWEDWVVLGTAIEAGRNEAMRWAGTNRPEGRGYNERFGEWLVRAELADLDKGDRSRLMKCMEHRVEIEQWRATLTMGEKLRLNHPRLVLQKWQAATRIPDPEAENKPSPMARLKEELAGALEENVRLKTVAEGGDLWNPKDSSAEIANALAAELERLTESKARKVLKLASEYLEGKWKKTGRG